MSAVAETSQALAAALRTVPKLRVYTDPGAVIDPPGVLVGPPRLTWGGYVGDPTDALFVVTLAVPADDRALERLWDLVPQVAEAIDTVPDAVVRSAEPGMWTTGNGTDLPCYLINVECSL